MSVLDINPRKGLTARLMGMVQSLNNQLKVATQKTEQIQAELLLKGSDVTSLQQKYQRLADMYLCKTCQMKSTLTPPGDTIELCHACSSHKESVQELKETVQQMYLAKEEWKERYRLLYEECRPLEEVIVK